MKTKAGRAKISIGGGRPLIMILGVAVILCTCFAMVATPAKAATFDGTYDITLSGNTKHDFLIISNGRISDAGYDGTSKNFPASKQIPPPSPPSPVGGSIWLSWTGSVDSSGNANWHGGCFVAGLNLDYTYIGVIRSDGTGSGTWSRVDGEQGTWSVEKSSSILGGIGSSVSVPIAGLAGAATVIGLVASSLSAPKPASAQFMSGPPPLRPPEQSLQMDLQQPGTTAGNHLVPVDAPMQAPSTGYPANYPGSPGTNGSMTCQFCGMPTLSPFTTGWFCTNSQCPARRDRITRGYTRHEFNNMTWRGQEGMGHFDATQINPTPVQSWYKGS